LEGFQKSSKPPNLADTSGVRRQASGVRRQVMFWVILEDVQVQVH